MGLNFAIYGMLHRAGKRSGDKSNVQSAGLGCSVLSSTAVCGAIAGGVSKFIVYPLDTLKRRFQAQVIVGTFHLSDEHTNAHSPQEAAERYRSGVLERRQRYSGILHGIREIFRKEGIRGFYKVYIGRCTHDNTLLFIFKLVSLQ